MLLHKQEIRWTLPKVGDKLMEVPMLAKTAGAGDMVRPALPCVVIEVNREKLWYRVRFEAGYTECYKLPKIKVGPMGGYR